MNTLLRIVATAILATTAASAELLAWLHFGETIPGDSSAPGREGWTDVTGVGFVQTDGSRKLRFRCQVDKATPLLMNACCSGSAIDEVKLDLVRSGGEFWQVRLRHVEVTAFEIGHSPDLPQPHTTVELSWKSLVSSYFVRPPGEPPYPISTLISVDTDGDGLPDAYEEQAGLDPSVSNLDTDSDNDDLPDIDEYRLGTHPNDPGSFFRVTATGEGDTLEIVWPSVAGKTYSIDFSPDLLTPFESLDEVTATGPETRRSITRVSSAAFFRVSENPP